MPTKKHVEQQEEPETRVKYHLFEHVPDYLRLNKETGELFCSDGLDVKEYLKQVFKNLPDDEPLTIVPASTQRVQNELCWQVFEGVKGLFYRAEAAEEKPKRKPKKANRAPRISKKVG